MRITVVISSLACGGAERTALAIVNHWAERGYKITLLTFEEIGIPPFYEVNQSIKLLPLGLAKNSHNLSQRIWNNLRRLITLRVAIQKSTPDFVLSFLNRTNIRTLLSLIGTGVPVVISEQTDPVHGNLARNWQWLRNRIYPLASRVVTHTEQAAQYLTNLLGCEVVVIPNPVTPFEIKQQVTSNMASVIVAVGALEREKGFDLLLRSLAQITAKHPNTILRILGEGTQRTYLESLRAELGLNNQVYLPGRVKNIFSELSKADLFVMPSRIEGFGNALCEAMACGLPVIATDCMGPREIVRNGIDGLLVPVGDVKALANTISDLLENKQQREHLSMQAREIMKRVSLTEVMKHWDNLLAELK